MNIAHVARTVAPLHKPGGLEKAVAELSRELARLGHTVHIFARPPDLDRRDLLVDEPWGPGVTYTPLPYPALFLKQGNVGFKRDGIADRLLNYTRWTRSLQKQVLAAGPFDGIYAQGMAAAGFTQQIPPLVFNPQGLEEFKAAGAKHLALLPLRVLLQRAANQAAATIATDRALIPDIKKYLHLADERIAVIPNAVDLAALDALTADARTQQAIHTWQERLSLPSHALAQEALGIEPTIMLSVGRIEANKGLNVLADALAQLPGELPPWRWIIAGDGSARSALEAQIARLGLQHHVVFAGRVDDPTLHALYEIADMFVHPTLYEGSSLVTLEAQAHRRMVVASNTGGLPDKVIDVRLEPNGATGLLVRPGDAADLADALIYALRRLSPAERQKLGEQGRERVEKQFTWAASARATADLFEGLQPRTKSPKI